MTRKGTNPDPPADAVKPDPPPSPPKPAPACHKCGTVLEGEKDRYWHARGDSAGCIRSEMGMILDLHERLAAIEAAFEKVGTEQKTEDAK